jgi:hypothetical protein
MFYFIYSSDMLLISTLNLTGFSSFGEIFSSLVNYLGVLIFEVMSLKW